METAAVIIVEIAAFAGAFFAARATSFAMDASSNPVLHLPGIAIRVVVFVLAWGLLGGVGLLAIDLMKVVI
jgi:hypothetical protein